MKFTDKINNSPHVPFIPKIRIKPNALTPLPSNLNIFCPYIESFLVAILSQLDSYSVDSLRLDEYPEL